MRYWKQHLLPIWVIEKLFLFCLDESISKKWLNQSVTLVTLREIYLNYCNYYYLSIPENIVSSGYAEIRHASSST